MPLGILACVCVCVVKKQATQVLKFVNRDGDSTIQQFPRTEREAQILYCLQSFRVKQSRYKPGVAQRVPGS